MGNLVRAECFKLLKPLLYKILLFCSVVTGCLFSIMSIMAGSGNTGYLQILDSMGSIFFNAMFGGGLAAVFICSEFEERTFGISLSCGVSRRNIFIAKVIVFLIGMFSLLIVWTVAMVTVNSFVNGFGKVSYIDVILQISYGLAGYAAQGAVIILVAVIIKKMALTVFICMGFTYIFSIMKENPQFYGNSGIPFFIKYIYLYQIELFKVHEGGMFYEDGFNGSVYLIIMFITFILALIAALFIFEKTEFK